MHDDKQLSYLLPQLVQAIELFAEREGHYPSALSVFDSGMRGGANFKMDKQILERVYYSVEAGGRGYQLFGIGIDGKPFTDDDISIKLKQ